MRSPYSVAKSVLLLGESGTGAKVNPDPAQLPKPYAITQELRAWIRFVCVYVVFSAILILLCLCIISLEEQMQHKEDPLFYVCAHVLLCVCVCERL